MSEKLKPFIPSWLDDAGLSPSQFRVMAHLLRRADKKGVAYPSYDSMSEITGMSGATIRRAIDELKTRELIAMIGKPFAGSCRYKVLPIVAPEILLDTANSCTRDTIGETLEPLQESNTVSPAIIAPQPPNTISHATPIVAPEIEEGYPLKGIPLRKSNKSEKYEPSSEAVKLSTLFKSSLPTDLDPSSTWKTSWPKVFDQLIAKGRNPDEIDEIIRWGRTDSFWRSNFMAPAKLTKRNKDGVTYYDVFKEKMNSAKSSASPAKHSLPDTSNRPNQYEEA